MEGAFGVFKVLPYELFLEILVQVEDDKTYAICCRVNKQWKEDSLLCWRGYCKKRNLLEEETFWQKFGRDWLWICRMKTKPFDPVVQMDGIGWQKNGLYHEGEWKLMVRHGLGMSIDDGYCYKGQWVNDHPDGEGLKVWDRGDTYTGSWKQGLREGFGVYSYATGNKYVGNWLHDKKNGKGTFHWTNGDKYDGEWQDGRKTGFGVYYYGNGDRYEGSWDASIKEGFGKYVYKNGDYYWGFGKFTWINGDEFCGLWQDDDRNGPAYGGVYEGNYAADERDGGGSFSWPDQDRYEGEWKNGGRHGEGLLFCSNGEVYLQTWNEEPSVNYSTSPPPKFPPAPEHSVCVTHLFRNKA